tara:strand:- start:735 stop:1145 length:411 start_codon:yes stop_codon:yes gene_type:complete
MSTLSVANLQSLTTSTLPVVKNSAGTELGRFVKAWVNFNGSTVTSATDMTGVRDSFNISSVVDNGTGEYTVNFQNAFADTNYCAVAGGSQELDSTARPDGVMVHTYTTTSVNLEGYGNLTGTAEADLQIINLIITN